MTTAAPLTQLVRHLRQKTELHPFENLPDAELLERFRTQGDVEAFAAIIRRHGLGVLAACRKVLTSDADVEDVFQATFVVLLRGAAAIRRDASLSSWLYGVAHRLALKTLEADRRRRRAEQRQLAAVAAEPDLSLREACAILHEELDRLPDQYRLPLLLCYLEGLSRDEAAQQLGWTFDVLRGRLERGRERLRSRLTRRGVTLSVGLLAAVANSGTAGVVPDRVLQATLAASTGRVLPTVAGLVQSVTPAVFFGKLHLPAVLLVGLLCGGLGVALCMTPPVGDAPAQSARPAKVPQEAVAAAERPTVADPDSKPVPVSGKVIGPDGKPVPGAKLFLFDAELRKTIPQGETNSEGGFALELQPLGDLRSHRILLAAAPSLGLGCDWVRMTSTTEQLHNAVLKLPKDEPIRGRLIDLEGKPVAGAKVHVITVQTAADDTLNEFIRLWAPEKKNYQQALRTLSKEFYPGATGPDFLSATTDTDGRFSLRGIGLDRCPQLTVSARGLASHAFLVPIRRDFKPPSGTGTGNLVFGPTFTLALTPAKPISGVIRDSAKAACWRPGVRPTRSSFPPHRRRRRPDRPS